MTTALPLPGIRVEWFRGLRALEIPRLGRVNVLATTRGLPRSRSGATSNAKDPAREASALPRPAEPQRDSARPQERRALRRTRLTVLRAAVRDRSVRLVGTVPGGGFRVRPANRVVPYVPAVCYPSACAKE